MDILTLICQENITAVVYFKSDTYWLKPQSIKYCIKKPNKKPSENKKHILKELHTVFINSYHLFI